MTEPKTSLFSFKNILIAALVIVLIYLLTCNKSVEKAPVVIKGATVRELINMVDIDKKRIEDSFKVILHKAYKDNEDNYTNYVNMLNQNSALYQENRLLQIPYPDTCKKIVSLWMEREQQIRAASDNKDKAAMKTITGLQGTVAEQQRFLTAKDTLYAKMRSIADTAGKALVALEKYISKISPKREVSVGISGITPYNEIKPSLGLVLGYRGKNGMQVQAGYYLNKNITVTISKPLFKF